MLMVSKHRLSSLMLEQLILHLCNEKSVDNCLFSLYFVVTTAQVDR